MNNQRRTRREIKGIIRNNMMKENKFLVYLGIILRNIVNVIKGILGFIFRLIGFIELKIAAYLLLPLIIYIIYILFQNDFFQNDFFQIEYSSNLSEYKGIFSNLLILLLIIFCIYNFETGKKKVKRGKKVEEKEKENTKDEDKDNVVVFAEDDEDGPLIVTDPDADL